MRHIITPEMLAAGAAALRSTDFATEYEVASDVFSAMFNAIPRSLYYRTVASLDFFYDPDQAAHAMLVEQSSGR